MKNSCFLRMATVQDAAAILSIYAPYIRQTPITFEYEVPTLAEFSERMQHILQDYPYLVCEEKGKIIGYGYASSYQERAAYQWDADLSIYFAPEATGRGLGRQMLLALVKILKLQGIKNVYSCVTHPNLPSERLHASLGFRAVGRFLKAGYKCGAWYDVIWFEKNISSCTDNPEKFRPIRHLQAEQIEVILNSENQ